MFDDYKGCIGYEHAKILVRGYEKASDIQIGENAIMAIRKKYIQSHHLMKTVQWAFSAIDDFATTVDEARMIVSEMLDSIISCGDCDIDETSRYIWHHLANRKIQIKVTQSVMEATKKSVTRLV